MKYLATYQEFKESKSETSNYEVPIAAVIPQKGDKIWNYVKSEITGSPLWGINTKKQEKKNQIIRK